MAAISLAGKYNNAVKRWGNSKSSPNLDIFWGPYSSLQEAFDTLKAYGQAVIGRPCGVTQSDGSVREYWFEKAASSINDLVKKGASADDMKVTVTTAKDEYVQFYKGAKNADIVVSYLSGIYTIGGGNIGDYIVDGKIYAECINEDGTHVDCSPNVGSSDSISPVTYKGRSLYPINLSEAEYDDSGNTTISHSKTPNNVYIVLYKKTASGSESEKTLAKAIQDNADAILDKAPYPSSKTDGKQYVMKNGVWVEVDIKTDADGISYTKDKSTNTTGTVGKALDDLSGDIDKIGDLNSINQDLKEEHGGAAPSSLVEAVNWISGADLTLVYNDRYNASEGSKNSASTDESRWGYYKSAEGTVNSSTEEISRWGKFNKDQATRNSTFTTQISTLNSTYLPQTVTTLPADNKFLDNRYYKLGTLNSLTVDGLYDAENDEWLIVKGTIIEFTAGVSGAPITFANCSQVFLAGTGSGNSITMPTIMAGTRYQLLISYDNVTVIPFESNTSISVQTSTTT